MPTCEYCSEPIEPDADWPLNGLHAEGIDIHDGCLDAQRSEQAKIHLAQVETLPTLPLSRVGRENASGGTRVTGRPVVACTCKHDPEAPCPRHGRWSA